MDGAFVEFQHVYASYKEPGGLGAFFKESATPPPVIQDVSFSLALGSQVAVFGFTASGKTTLMNLLRGTLTPDAGTIVVNGKSPEENKSINAGGYVSPHHEIMKGESVYDFLQKFGTVHGLQNLPAKIGEITGVMGIGPILSRNVSQLSTGEIVQVKLARAALSEAPLLLFDDVADVVGAEEMKRLLETIFRGRTACISTRSVEVAEALDIPLLLLHKSSLLHMGTTNDLAQATGVERIVDAWVEGMRYDLLRKLRSHPGVVEVRLMPTDQFEGTRVRVTIRNSRYLPALYDALSQAPLVTIQELPVALRDILDSLS